MSLPCVNLCTGMVLAEGGIESGADDGAGGTLEAAGIDGVAQSPSAAADDVWAANSLISLSLAL